MKETAVAGVFKDKNKLFTENPDICKGIKVYNEHLVRQKDKEYRSWNPYRSKLAVALLKGFTPNITPQSSILYLGAATGTTVSHLSDIIKNGMIYSVENSPIAIKVLLQLSKQRNNIIPILADANHPDRYSFIVPQVDIIYQDISQRNQAEIFVENVKRYLKKRGMGILMVKARSIDVALKPKKVYKLVCLQLKNSGINVTETQELAPYEKDHAAIVISN